MPDNERQSEWWEPKTVWEEYQTGARYKSNLGTRGLYEQNRINERFYAGDQWHGAAVGTDRPLVRYNVIKRIGEYKQAVIGAGPVTVSFSAEGVPNTVELQERVKQIREQMAADPAAGASLLFGDGSDDVPASEEVNLVMDAMSDYFRVTGERLQFDDKKDRVLKNAYTAGTGILYTYWDGEIRTGLYADEDRKTPIKGDIRCEVLDVENVYLGDPTLDDIQSQPYIIAARRDTVDNVRRMMKQYGASREETEALAPDSETSYMAGELGAEGDQNGAEKVTVLTKFYKQWEEDGSGYRVMAATVTENTPVREPWDTGLRLYPFSVFLWERRRNCAYGDSEVTYLIPNQIAINRMITANVWAVMMMGMPIMLVNRDVIAEDSLSNEPGQIIDVNGGDNDVAAAVRYLNPPSFSPDFSRNVDQMILQTLNQSGANSAALGDVRPDNTSAIIAVREAATMPLQMLQSRFYTFVEDTARIWAEFWLTQYGKRALKVSEDSGTWYMPFDGDRYRDLIVSARVEVGAGTLWSEAQSIATLDNLFDKGVIDVTQYLQRLPRGTVPGLEGLIRSLQEKQPDAQTAPAPETAEIPV